jgi:hypothetical protein
LRETLLEFRRKYRERRAHWRDPDAIRERYLRACEKLHIGSQYYHLEFGIRQKAPELSFRKDPYQVGKAEALFGKNVIVTDNHDWTNEEIAQLSLDRYGVEKLFRDSKSSDHHLVTRAARLNDRFHRLDTFKELCNLLSKVGNPA